jgi:hypothetical protein
MYYNKAWGIGPAMASFFGNLVVSHAPSEDGPKGPKHVRDLKTLNNK